MTFFKVRFFSSNKKKEGTYNFFYLTTANKFFSEKIGDGEVTIFSDNNKQIRCKNGNFITLSTHYMTFQDETSVSL